MNNHSKRARRRLRKHCRWIQQIRQLILDPSAHRSYSASTAHVIWRGHRWSDFETMTGSQYLQLWTRERRVSR